MDVPGEVLMQLTVSIRARATVLQFYWSRAGLRMDLMISVYSDMKKAYNFL